MLGQLFSLFFPRLCTVCGKSLIPAEKLLCMGCISDLPRSGYWLRDQNVITDLFKAQIAVEHASSYLCYTKESPYHQLLHRLKYKGETNIGHELGRWFGAELLSSPFYQKVEMIVPVPLHPKKERQRGYNQSMVFAAGIAEVTGWRLTPQILTRIRHTATQTMLNREERQKNMAGAFLLSAPKQVEDKHILLVDDVLTTGATLQTCAAALRMAPGCTLYMATIVHIE